MMQAPSALLHGLLLAAALVIAPAHAEDAGDEPAAKPAATASKAKPAATTAKAKPAVTTKAAATPAKPAAAPAKAAGNKPATPPSATKSATASRSPTANKKAGAAKAVAKKGEPATPGPLADFGQVTPSEDAAHVANWVSYTRNAKGKAFVVIDKKQARMYVFSPQGKLKSHSPVLLGKAVGDYTTPGVGEKPLSQLKEHEKTTPAGRFLVHNGRNLKGEDILWIDYNAAVSMHRMRKVAAEERRAERMATEDISDNRISNGCVNVPHKFYDAVLKPTVTKQGAYVYVLPETRTPQQQFGSFDVPAAQAKAAAPAKPA